MKITSLKMILQNIHAFEGEHCETTAIGTLLAQLGINYSEPMLFGLGEGLGFLFWNMKIMDFPFLGGRIKPDLLTENICRNLNLDLKVTETASRKKSWNIVEQPLAEGKVVGLKLDCYHLEYFTAKIHFAGHYVAMYGFDDKDAYLVDTAQQGGRVKTSLESLALARIEKGAMASKNRTFTIHKNNPITDLKTAIPIALKNNANDFLNPPITNFAYKGILRTSKEILKWFKESKDVKTEFQTAAMIMERAGTGGSLFRNLYRDFIGEAAAVLQNENLKEVEAQFAISADLWKQVSELMHSGGGKNDITYIEEASEILVRLSTIEKRAMELLINCLK